MCVFDYSERKRKVLLSYLPKLVSIASVLALKPLRFQSVFEKFYADYASAQNPTSSKRDEDREQMRDASRFFLFFPFFFFSPPPFLLPCSFNIRNSRVFAKNTRARASFPCRENYISKIHFQSFFLFLTRGHALVLARARVAHDEYLCSYARHTCTDWR